jgi:hypothetical protein
VAKATTKTVDTTSNETATQEEAPLAANTTGASVPEVEGEHEPDEAEEKKAPQKWVVYKDAQHFEIRTITPKDWAKVGVEDGKLLHWHKGNDFRVPLEELGFLSEGQIQQYILSEPRFAIVED